MESKKISLQHREQNVVLTGRSVKAIPAEEERQCQPEGEQSSQQEATVSVFTSTQLIWLPSCLCSNQTSLMSRSDVFPLVVCVFVVHFHCCLLFSVLYLECVSLF